MKLPLSSYPFLLICISLVIFSCKKNNPPDPEPEDILTQLQSIEGATVIELDAVDHFNRLFEIKLEQPVDHNQPEGAQFLQKIYIGHINENLPVAFETEGYARSSNRTRELSVRMNFNQIGVEHRYFGESVPAPLDWQYLTIWQSANDHHRIVELFKKIYPKAWVSSGASKGGNAAMFHRRFFPDDVQATVAYVAPLLFEEYDQRYLTYYDTVGDATCRQKIKNYQKNILMKIDSFPPLFEGYVHYVNDTYNTNFTFSLPYENILYHSIREDFPFEFWSSPTEDCSTIPEDNATAQELFDHYVAVMDIFLFFSDYGVEFWTPWFYQAKTEIGSYAYDTSHLDDLVFNYDPLVTFNVPTQFSPNAMLDIQNWIQTEASQMIFIYGKDDPWTVAAPEFQNTDDLIKITNPGTKHGTRISDLSGSDQALVEEKLTLWLGL